MKRRRPRPDPATQEEWIFGVHPVQELLTHRRSRVERLFVARDAGGGLGRILREARDAGIPVSHLPRNLLTRRVGRPNHQGIAARVSPRPYADADEVCARAAARPGGLLILVDGVVDPGNLGAIVRSAAGAGADGLLVSAEATVGLTSVVAKASAGAIESLPVAREPRPPRRVESLREQGFQAVALMPRAETPWNSADLTGRVVVVVGGEERGVRPGLARVCNVRVSIPLAPAVESLNVSVATAVLLFEAIRQRRSSPGS